MAAYDPSFMRLLHPVTMHFGGAAGGDETDFSATKRLGLVPLEKALNACGQLTPVTHELANRSMWLQLGRHWGHDPNYWPCSRDSDSTI